MAVLGPNVELEGDQHTDQGKSLSYLSQLQRGVETCGHVLYCDEAGRVAALNYLISLLLDG